MYFFNGHNKYINFFREAHDLNNSEQIKINCVKNWKLHQLCTC